MDLGDSTLKPIKVLGAGAFGRVFLCKYRNTQNVCVKRIIVQNPKNEMKMIMEEVYIISQLRHPNIVQFIRSFVHAGTVNIVMEYAEQGTLFDKILQVKSNFSHSDIERYFCDTLLGLEYLHIRDVLHRDLKPANLLIDSNNHIKIADFGISLISSTNRSSVKLYGTAYYSAPEVLRCEKYDYKSDIWSLGCILYEMCIGNSPFSKATNMEGLLNLVHALTRHKLDCSNIRNKYGSLWANLCEQMLVANLRNRVSLSDILFIDPVLTISYYNKYLEYKY